MFLQPFGFCISSLFRYCMLRTLRSCTIAYTRLARPRMMSSSTAATSPLYAPPGSIHLNDKEEKFVQLLDQFARSLQPPIECRIAGGWVRDKLLDLPSHDLDVALSTTSGYQFAVDFAHFLHAHNVTTGSVGRVAANPEQSKHLETGTTRVMDLECDFVGLRSETYSDSRIPDQVQLGTPLEDAERRDLTLNSLFFNVHSRQVEDWTRHGLEDLKNKVARTPLPPRQTFLDDPLRVLRAVRFASRFDLAIEPSVEAAIKNADIQTALQSKVSKERVGIETTKMMHKNPLLAIQLIHRLGLHEPMFTCSVPPPHPRSEALAAAEILHAAIERGAGEGTELLWLAAATCPYRDAEVPGKKPVPAVSAIMAEGLKLSTEHRNGVAHLFDAAKMLDPSLEGRSRIGIVLQNTAVRPWRQSFVWAIVMRILPTWKGLWTSEHDEVLSTFFKFRDHIEELGLPTAIDQHPIVDVSCLVYCSSFANAFSGQASAGSARDQAQPTVRRHHARDQRVAA